MNTITTTLVTEAAFSDDGLKRYTLKKLWDETKPKLAVIMLAPSTSSGIAIDTSTQLCLTNADRLGYGSITIVNLFATLNDFSLKQAKAEDAENLDAIVAACQEADTIVYAPGVGKASNKAFQARQEQTLLALRPMESKLHCLCSESGEARLQHPLSPAVRTWCLSPLEIKELLPKLKRSEAGQKKKRSPKVAKVEPQKQES